MLSHGIKLTFRRWISRDLEASMGLCDEGRSYVRPPADMFCIPSSLVRQFYRVWGIRLPLICCGIYSSIWVVCDPKLSILQNITGHKTNKRRHCNKDRRDLHLKVSINTLRKEHSCKKSSKQRKSIALLMFRFIGILTSYIICK